MATTASQDNAAGGSSGSAGPALRDRVQAVINLIRPAVQADGLVQIRFHGACHGCPSSTMTLQDGIQRNLREKVPEVTRVVPVT